VLGLYGLTDHLMGRIRRTTELMGRPITCLGKKCSACCYEPVYADWLEVDHILGRATPQLRKQVKQRTVEWLAKVEPSGLLDEQQPNVIKWRELKAACPFLEADECTVYKDRPSACRQHCAVGPVERCVDDSLRGTQLFMMSPEVDQKLAVAMMETGKFLRQDNLGVLLADILLKKNVPSADRRIWKWNKKTQSFAIES
jgi:Fe-S-cluster containining protein